MERPYSVEIPCGHKFNYNEICSEGNLCDNCQYIVELENELKYMEKKNDDLRHMVNDCD